MWAFPCGPENACVGAAGLSRHFPPSGPCGGRLAGGGPSAGAGRALRRNRARHLITHFSVIDKNISKINI
jgi:hypothetical protein